MSDKALENLRAALKNARKVFAPPPAIDLPTGEENLRRALRVARKAFAGPEAYAAAREAEEDRQWQKISDAHARLVRWSLDAHRSIEE
jgi:hypothetical protein